MFRAIVSEGLNANPSPSFDNAIWKRAQADPQFSCADKVQPAPYLAIQLDAFCG
jgi:hypothetical protein